jgi:hypothetical protein
MTYEQSSTTGVRARMLRSLWRGHVSADKTSRVATSTRTSVQFRPKLQGMLESRRASHWLALAAPHLRIISARQLGHPSSGHTCRRSTTGHQTRRNSYRFTSPPLQQLVETLL